MKIKAIQRKKRKKITKTLHSPEAGVSELKDHIGKNLSFAAQEAK